MIYFLFICGFIIRLLTTIQWYQNHKENKLMIEKKFVPTKKQALKFYLIPFYWIYWLITNLFNNVFK